MSFNISDYLTAATQKYYGVDVSSTTAQDLWKEFCSKIETPTKEYLAITSGAKREEVRAALSDIIQGAIASMVAEDETPPDLLSTEVQVMIDTLTEKLVTLRGQPELEGLSSPQQSIVYSTLTTLCADMTLTQALTSLLTRAASTIAERGSGLPTLYLNFLSSKVEAAKTSEATVALSPREEEVRRIMFEIFNLALDMIRILQNCSQLQSNLLYYYTDLQREYTAMMSKTPMYGPTPNQAIVADPTDFGKTKLGYGNITVRSMAEYLLSEIDKTTGPTFVKFENTTYKQSEDGTISEMKSPIKFVLWRDSQGGYIFDVMGYIGGLYYLFLSTKWISADGTNYSASSPEISTNVYKKNTGLFGTRQNTDLINMLMNHLTHQWNDTPDSYSQVGTIIAYADTDPNLRLDNLGQVKLAWSANAPFLEWTNIMFTGPLARAYEKALDDTGTTQVDEAVTAQQRASTFRSEANMLLQIYMENARALKDAAKNASKRTESVLTQVKESLQNQANLLSAITESLRGMLSAIFR